jgi:formylglycine-generating enzyme required for sulfatase activity
VRLALVAVLTFACGRVGFDGGVRGDARDDVGLGDGTTADAPSPRSCMTLQANCGPGSDQSCCDSPLVTGGTFDRGYDLAIDGNYPDQSSPATISTFHLDRYEVTVGRFRNFVMAGYGTQQNPPAAGAGAHPNVANSGWDPAWSTNLHTDTAALLAALKCDPIWTDSPGANDNRPVVCVTWFEVTAFCAWDGGFVPTETEWHYAASGGSEQRAYPWSNPPGDVTIDCNHANYAGCGGSVDNVGARSPAGDGRWGQADLAGNALEWVLDWNAPYVNPCSDCANLTAGGSRLARGGAIFDGIANLRAGSRYHAGPPTDHVGGVGFRCARQ